MSGTNKEHLCNCHIYLEGLCHIRGIIVYKKMKGTQEELLLKFPAYGERGHETAYINLTREVADAIYEAVRTIPKEQYSRFYTGPKDWSIWMSSVVKP
jgi:hypothetical protein